MRASLQYTLAGVSLIAVATLIASGAIYHAEDVKTKTAATRAADHAKALSLDAEMHRQEHLAATIDDQAGNQRRRQLEAQNARDEANSPAARELRRLENEDRAALGLAAR
jgi:hypothetical protein